MFYLLILQPSCVDDETNEKQLDDDDALVKNNCSS